MHSLRSTAGTLKHLPTSELAMQQTLSLLFRIRLYSEYVLPVYSGCIFLAVVNPPSRTVPTIIVHFKELLLAAVARWSWTTALVAAVAPPPHWLSGSMLPLCLRLYIHLHKGRVLGLGKAAL